MKKILSLLLCAVLALSLLPSSAYAVETFTTSPAGVQMIASFEGYKSMPYMDDRGRWYIGYGTSCDPAQYPYGISEQEAYGLLVSTLHDKEESVNGLLLQYGIQLDQAKFDALVSMTYTLGTQWMDPTYRLCSYLINGVEKYQEADIVNGFATWCHVGDEPVEALADRRLREAFLFLYGTYENNGPQSYRFIHFRPEGGRVENRTIFYPVGRLYGALPAPQGNGNFLGWFTEDGRQLTGQETAMENIYVRARWDGETIGPAPKPDQDLSKWVNPYRDVKEKDWFFPYVRELSANGVVHGNPDGTFKPESFLKAGEALKLILLAAGNSEQAPTAKHWASGYLSLAERLGCVAPGEVQDLDAQISRLTIAKVAAVAMGLQPKNGTSPFADVQDGYAQILYERGILKGTVVGRQRYYYPGDSIKRSEVCAIVSRILNWERDPGMDNDPKTSGYIYYKHAPEKYLPVLPNVPVCPYEPNLFVRDGSTMYYNGQGYSPVLGVDVSSHQGDIDWVKVKNAGIEFAFIRQGFRGYGPEGTINPDKNFQQNLSGAKAAGIKTGVYFFSSAITPAEAVEEANFLLASLGGQPLEYPVVYDWEPASKDGRAYNLDKQTLTACTIAFCETVARAGYTPMIYYNTPVGYTRMDLSQLTGYDVWYAQYSFRPTMYYDYRIWQYTSSGKVPGIEGKVDMNIAMRPY